MCLHYISTYLHIYISTYLHIYISTYLHRCGAWACCCTPSSAETCLSTTTWRSSRPDCPSQGHTTYLQSTYLHIYVSTWLHISISTRQAGVGKLQWPGAPLSRPPTSEQDQPRPNPQVSWFSGFMIQIDTFFSYSGITGSFLEDTRSTFALQSWRGRSHLRRCGDCRLTGDWVSFITFTHQPTIILRSHWCTCALYVLALLACSQ